MPQKRRPANDRAFKKYKTENKRLKNKIKKIKKHIEKYPNDENAKEQLKRVEKGKISPKTPSKSINVEAKEYYIRGLYLKRGEGSKTAGEQLAELLGLEYNPKKQKKRKPRITRKKKRNVNKS